MENNNFRPPSFLNLIAIDSRTNRGTEGVVVVAHGSKSHR